MFYIIICQKNEITKKINNLIERSSFILSQENIIEKAFQVEYIIHKLSEFNEDLREEFSEKRLETVFTEKVLADCKKSSKCLFF